MNKMFPEHNVVLLYDTETTGPNFFMDKVIEFGYMLVEDGKISEKGSILIDWGIEIPEFITELTGITQDDINFRGISPEEFYILLKDLLTRAMLLIAHNAAFDASMINSLLNIFGDHIKNYNLDFMDSLALIADFIPVDKKPRKPRKNSKEYDKKMLEYEDKIKDLQTHKLLSVCKYYGIELKNAHTALADIEAVYKVLKAFSKKEKRVKVSYYINKWGYKKRWQINPLAYYPENISLYSQGNNGEKYILNAKEEAEFRQ